MLAGGFGGCRRIAAHAELHGRAWSPHTWSNGYGFLINLHGALGLSSLPFVEVPYDPPTWSTARRDFLLPATVEIGRGRHDRAARRAGPGCRSRSRRARALPCRLTPIAVRAAVLREPGRPVEIETIRLDPPRAGEVQVRVAAAGVCHSDVHLADGVLGDGRWPMVLGHEGAGVVEAVAPGVTHVAPGDRVAFCFVPSCGAMPAVPRWTDDPVRDRGREHGARHADGRHARVCTALRATRCSTG